MSDPLWKRTDISITEHRLLWFLIDVGCVGHVAGRGWVGKCAVQMGLSRITVWRAARGLVEKGLAIKPRNANITINPEAFASPLPENFIVMRKETTNA